MNITLTSLETAKQELLNLKEQQGSKSKGWSPYVIFVHCSKTIEFSMSGYPALKPAIIRNTVGKIAFHKFMKQGYMRHDLMADVPGSEPIKDSGTFQEGKQILLQSIDKFSQYKGELQPHLLFGKLSKENYDQYFAMHIADHLSEL